MTLLPSPVTQEIALVRYTQKSSSCSSPFWNLASSTSSSWLAACVRPRLLLQIYAIEYHLAPEFKYPHQLLEVEAVLTWLSKNGKARGVDPARICIGEYFML